MVRKAYQLFQVPCIEKERRVHSPKQLLREFDEGIHLDVDRGNVACAHKVKCIIGQAIQPAILDITGECSVRKWWVGGAAAKCVNFYLELPVRRHKNEPQTIIISSKSKL